MSLWVPVAVVCLIIIVALMFNLMGIHIMKGLPAWQEWRGGSYWYFFAWRVALYSVILWVWVLYRDRLLHRDPSPKQRLRRTETAVILSLLSVELIRAQLHLGA